MKPIFSTSFPEANSLLSPVSRVLLVVCAVLAAYYPALHGDINYIDDVHILDRFGLNGGLTLRDILLPGKGYYFRPLTDLSHFMDGRLWGTEASFMHLENILLHAVNSLLVMLLAVRLAPVLGVRSDWFPLAASLLFALHPVNSEAVCWIAGRSDLLAAPFVLGAACLMVLAMNSGRRRHLFAAALLLVGGGLAKEVALAFVPAACLIVAIWPKDDNRLMLSRRLVVLPFLALAVVLVLPLASHLLLGREGSGAFKLFSGASGGPIAMATVALQAFGFYVRKLVVPWPLNFAIASVDPGYFWLGLASLIALIPSLWRRNPFSGWFAAAVLLVAPALLVAVFRVAWTPVAERYLYLPSAFFAVALTAILFKVAERHQLTSWLAPAAATLLIPAAILVYTRAILWQDNLRLYEDTLSKSPGFGRLRNDFGVALIRQGRIDEGLHQLTLGKTQNNNPEIARLMGLNELAASISGKEPEEARRIILGDCGELGRVDSEKLRLLNRLNERRLADAVRKVDQDEVAREMLATNDILFTKTGEPHHLYRNGQLALDLGDRRRAARYFAKAAAKAPEGAFYRSAAAKLALRLGEQQ